MGARFDDNDLMVQNDLEFVQIRRIRGRRGDGSRLVESHRNVDLGSKVFDGNNRFVDCSSVDKQRLGSEQPYFEKR